jgi:hypothetical protein
MTTPIPQPRTIPFLGNIASLEAEVPLRSMYALAKEYGEIFQLDLPGAHHPFMIPSQTSSLSTYRPTHCRSEQSRSSRRSIRCDEYEIQEET